MVGVKRNKSVNKSVGSARLAGCVSLCECFTFKANKSFVYKL